MSTIHGQTPFSELFLLHKLIEGYPVNVLLTDDEKFLEPLLEWLQARGAIKIEVDYYEVTGVGKDLYQKFMNRYLDFLIHFDVYCGVDLAEGVFAFESYWKIEDEKEWQQYLNQPRFEDLRIAVARYKKIKPEEIVFLSFLNEGRFESITSTVGWQFDLASGKLWEEINEIVDSAIKVEQLAFKDKGDYIQGEVVLSDIIKSGAELNVNLWTNQEAYFNEEYDFDLAPHNFDQQLENYRDKDYINPLWKDDWNNKK